MCFCLADFKPQCGQELGNTSVIVIRTTQTVTEDDAVTCLLDPEEFVLKEREVLCVSSQETLDFKLSDRQQTSNGVSTSCKFLTC